MTYYPYSMFNPRVVVESNYCKIQNVRRCLKSASRSSDFVS